MKISAFPTLLLLIVAAALGYLAYHLANSKADSNDIFVGIGTGISILLTLGCVLSVSMEDCRKNVNLKAWSITAFILYSGDHRQSLLCSLWRLHALLCDCVGTITGHPSFGGMEIINN